MKWSLVSRGGWQFNPALHSFGVSNKGAILFSAGCTPLWLHDHELWLQGWFMLFKAHYWNAMMSSKCRGFFAFYCHFLVPFSIVNIDWALISIRAIWCFPFSLISVPSHLNVENDFISQEIPYSHITNSRSSSVFSALHWRALMEHQCHLSLSPRRKQARVYPNCISHNPISRDEINVCPFRWTIAAGHVHHIPSACSESNSSSVVSPHLSDRPRYWSCNGGGSCVDINQGGMVAMILFCSHWNSKHLEDWALLWNGFRGAWHCYTLQRDQDESAIVGLSVQKSSLNGWLSLIALSFELNTLILLFFMSLTSFG